MAIRVRDLVGLAQPAAQPTRPERAAGPSASRKDVPMTTEDRTLPLPELADLSAEELAGALGRVASQATASAPQQSVLAQAPVAPQPVEPVVTAANGYTKTRLGTVVLVGNVGASRNIVYKRVAGRELVEFSFAARTLGHVEPTWYRCTVWDGAEETLELIRQGTYLQLKGQAVQSQSHRTGKLFLDVTVQRLAEGPAKGQQLTVAATAAAPKGYFARLWDALRGR